MDRATAAHRILRLTARRWGWHYIVCNITRDVFEQDLIKLLKNKPATGARLLKKQKSNSADLAGIELIFSIVAIMVLCFGFVLETALITQGCFSYCSA